MGRYIISLFDGNRPTGIQAAIVEQVLLKKNLNFKMWGETSTFILRHKALFWHLCQSGTLPGKVNIEVSSNIWHRNTFLATCLYAFGAHRQFQRLQLSIGHVPQLNWNWRALNRASFFSMVLNYTWNWNFSEVVISAPKVASANLHA